MADSGRRKRSINFHLARLGVPGAYSNRVRTGLRKNAPEERYHTLLRRKSLNDIAYDSHVGYKLRMKQLHPDVGGPDNGLSASDLNESYAVVRRWLAKRGWII